MIKFRDTVRFVETDLMGVVHHANYLRWFEMGRVAYLRACGITLAELMAEEIVFPVTDVQAKYKNSCTFDDEFEVQTTLAALNKAKLEFTYKIIRLRDGVVAAEGYSRNVVTDLQGHIIRLDNKWYDKIKKVYDLEKIDKE